MYSITHIFSEAVTNIQNLLEPRTTTQPNNIALSQCFKQIQNLPEELCKN